MYMRAVTFRIVYVGIVSVGILLSAAFRQSTVQAAAMAPVTAPQSRAPVEPGIVTLPTVQVRSVSTRSNAAAKAPATAKVVAAEARGESATGPRAASTPSLRLDMPYYSLGKMVPRVGKE